VQNDSEACNTVYYYICIDMNGLLENTPLVKFIRNYIQDLSGVFSISLLVKIMMTSPPFSWLVVQTASLSI